MQDHVRKSPGPSVRKQVLLTEEQAARLKALAKARGVSESDLAREALEAWLAIQPADEEDWRTGLTSLEAIWADYPEIDEIIEAGRRSWAKRRVVLDGDNEWPELLDTSILIDLLRQRDEALVTSVVSAMELKAGARSQREEQEIGRLLKFAIPLGVTLPMAERAGEHLKHYRSSHGLSEPDALIAATAEHHGLPLVTLNVNHFPMFAKLQAPY